MKKLTTLLGLAALAVSAFSQTSTSPSYFNGPSDATVVGSLKLISSVDNDFLMLLPRSTKPVVLEVGAIVPRGEQRIVKGSTLNFSVHTTVGSRGQYGVEVYMLDWSTGEWRGVAGEKAGGQSRAISVQVRADSFVHPKSGEVRSMIVWHQEGSIKVIGLDAVSWSIESGKTGGGPVRR